MGQNYSHFTDDETNHQEGPNSWPNEARGMFGTTLDPLTNHSCCLEKPIPVSGTAYIIKHYDKLYAQPQILVVYLVYLMLIHVDVWQKNNHTIVK